ncbi:hypothetical protein [Chitinophaga sp. RAB17]|uniref:hypothetical protein n=1 Tax=Chitinophaga sp. RAB17 TaxID=3233049 RepID=UPI003F8EA8CC
MKIPAFALLLLSFTVHAQSFKPLADSIRKAYDIPALGYAVGKHWKNATAIKGKLYLYHLPKNTTHGTQ